MFAEQFTQVDSLPKGRYAMWWPVTEEDRFTDSEVAKDIRRTYQAFDGLEPHALTFILVALGEDFGGVRVDLPEDLTYRPLLGPEDRLPAFSASREKGLRLHFGVENTRAIYRDRLWRRFADFAEDFRRHQIEAGGVPDADQETKPLDWWTLTEQAVSVPESLGQTVGVVGALVV